MEKVLSKELPKRLLKNIKDPFPSPLPIFGTPRLATACSKHCSAFCCLARKQLRSEVRARKRRRLRTWLDGEPPLEPSKALMGQKEKPKKHQKTGVINHFSSFTQVFLGTHFDHNMYVVVLFWAPKGCWVRTCYPLIF